MGLCAWAQSRCARAEGRRGPRRGGRLGCASARRSLCILAEWRLPRWSGACRSGHAQASPLAALRPSAAEGLDGERYPGTPGISDTAAPHPGSSLHDRRLTSRAEQEDCAAREDLLVADGGHPESWPQGGAPVVVQPPARSATRGIGRAPLSPDWGARWAATSAPGVYSATTAGVPEVTSGSKHGRARRVPWFGAPVGCPRPYRGQSTGPGLLGRRSPRRFYRPRCTSEFAPVRRWADTSRPGAEAEGAAAPSPGSARGPRRADGT